MDVSLTAADLVAFQDDIKERFLRGEIRHPIHLCDPNQILHLLEIFKAIQPQDWLFTSYRGMFHWLLKGVPPDELRAWIIEYGAMNFCDKERRIVSSAIVAGCVPIALGVALGIKRSISPAVTHRTGNSPHLEKVWCFVGDMAATGGTFHEGTLYGYRQDLPINFVIEDNGLSTNTPTQQVWGGKELTSWPLNEVG